MLGQFSKWLRRLPVEKDIMLNLLSAEWTVEAGGPIRDSDGGTARPWYLVSPAGDRVDDRRFATHDQARDAGEQFVR